MDRRIELFDRSQALDRKAKDAIDNLGRDMREIIQNEMPAEALAAHADEWESACAHGIAAVREALLDIRQVHMEIRALVKP